MAKLYPVSPPSLFPPLTTPPQITPPKITPPKLTGKTYNYASENSNYYNYLKGVQARKHVHDLGDVLLGDPLYGTKQLQNTLEDYGLTNIPGINRVEAAALGLYERQVKPFLDYGVTKGGVQSFINGLETLGDSLDILSNPVKAALGAGGGNRGEDFLRSLGLMDGEYRVSYNWDTDIDNPLAKFIADLGLEVISDPTFLLSGGANAISKSFKKGVQPAVTTIAKEIYDDFMVQVKKVDNADEVLALMKKFDIDTPENIQKFLMEYLEENPEAVIKAVEERQNNIKDILKAYLKEVIVSDDLELYKNVDELISKLNNLPSLSKETRDKVTNSLKTLYDSTAYKRYYSAKAFSNSVKKVDDFIGTASLIAAYPQAYAAVRIAKKNKDLLSKFLNELYFRMPNFEKELKANPNNINYAMNNYWDRVDSLKKNEIPKRRPYNDALNIGALGKKLSQEALLAPLNMKYNAEELYEYLYTKAKDLVIKNLPTDEENAILKDALMLDKEYLESYIKNAGDTDRLKNLELYKETLQLHNLIEDIVAESMEVANKIEQHQTDRLNEVLEDLVKKDSFTVVNSFRTTINNTMQQHGFKSLDELVTNFRTLSSVERNSLKLLGITESNINQLVELFKDIDKRYIRYKLDDKLTYEDVKRILKSRVDKAKALNDTKRLERYRRRTKDIARYKEDTDILKDILIKGLKDYYQEQGYKLPDDIAKDSLKHLNDTVERLSHIEDTLHPEVKDLFKPRTEVTNVNTKPNIDVSTLFRLHDTSDELIQHIADAYSILEIPDILKTLIKDIQNNDFSTFIKELKKLKDSDINLIIKTLDNYLSLNQMSPTVLKRYEYLATKELKEGLTDTETIELDNLLTDIRRNSNNELKEFVAWLKEFVSNKEPVFKAENIKAPIQEIMEANKKALSDYKIMQLNKTVQDIHYVQKVADMLNTTFTDLYINPKDYMKNINNSINVIAKQNKELGAQLKEATHGIFKQMLQTTYFMSEILNPIGIDILPRELRDRYIMRMHDLLRMFGNSTEDLSTVDNIVNLIVPEMETIFIKAEELGISRDTIIEQLIRPSIQNYIDKSIYLNDLFPNVENKFFNNIDDNTIKNLGIITSSVNKFIESDFKNIDNAHNVLEALVELSNITPIYYRDLLKEITPVTEQGLLENIKTRSEASILNSLNQVQYINRATNAEFQNYKFLEDLARQKVDAKHIDRFLELQKRFDTGDLIGAESTEYYALRKLLKDYIVPSNVFDAQSAIKLINEKPGLNLKNAYDIPRETILSTYNDISQDLIYKFKGLKYILKDDIQLQQMVAKIQGIANTLKESKYYTYRRDAKDYYVKLFDFIETEIKKDGNKLSKYSPAVKDEIGWVQYPLGALLNPKEGAELYKDATMRYLKINEPVVFARIYDDYKAYLQDLDELEAKSGLAKYKADKIKADTLRDIDRNATYIDFLLQNERDAAIRGTITNKQFDRLFEYEELDKLFRTLDEIASGTKGVNGDYFLQLKKRIEKFYKIKTGKAKSKYFNELTTNTNDAWAIGVSQLHPKEIRDLISAVNPYGGVIALSNKATFKSIKDMKYAGLEVKPILNYEGNKVGYLVYSTAELKPITQEHLNEIIGKIGIPVETNKSMVEGREILEDITNHFKDMIKYKTENGLDLSGLQYYYRGHNLNRDVIENLYKSNKYKLTGSYADIIKNTKHIKDFESMPDFAFMIDAGTYNHLLESTLDVTDYTNVERMMRRQSMLQSMTKGISDAIKYKEDAYKGMQIFFEPESVYRNQTSRILHMFDEYNGELNKFLKDNNVELFGYGNNMVPVVLVKNKQGLPEVHKIVIRDKETLNKFKAKNGILVPMEVYSFLSKNVTQFADTGLRKVLYTIIKPTYALAYLFNPGFLFRNAIDTLFIKNMSSAEGTKSLPNLFKHELEALEHIKTYEKCMVDVRKIAHEMDPEHEYITKYVINKAFKDWSLEEKKSFLTVFAWKDTAAAADLASDMRALLNGNKELSDLTYNRILKTIGTPVNNVNGYIEQIGRLGLWLYNIDTKQMNVNDALQEVIKTHFNYQIKDRGLEYLRDFFMFETFPINNVLYYLDIGLHRNPDVLKMIMDIEEESWNNGDISWDDVRKNPYLYRNVMMGNIRIGDVILKTGSSFIDFMNVISSPVSAVQERANPLIRAGLKQDLNQALPWMAYPSRINQIKKFINTQGEEGSILPSVYAKLYNGASTYKNNRRSYVRTPSKWTKYPKIRKPHKTYIRNYRFYTKPYYFKKPNTLAWAASKRDWNIRPTFKYPKGSYYSYMRRVNKLDNLNKFGPEVY